MAWTLQLADEDGNILTESFAILDDELVQYLSGLKGFPYLRGLQNLSTSEETWVDEEARLALEREIIELARGIQRKEIPEPPRWVGQEGTGDIRLGEELGWRGLLHFLQRLEHLLHLARTMELELWALPDD